MVRPRRLFKGDSALAAFDAIVAKNLTIRAYCRLRDELIADYEAPELLFDYASASGSKTIVELGTAACYSIQGLLRAASLNGGKVFSFDPCMYTGYVPTKYRSYWKFTQSTGEEGFSQWDKSSQVDLLYIDTNPHSYEQTKMWLEKHWVKLVKPGGLILFDDGAEWEQQQLGFGVLEAVKQFVEQNQERVEFFLLEDNAPPFHGVAVVKLVAAA
jgi:predicted O-methyltransferase YrrM